MNLQDSIFQKYVAEIQPIFLKELVDANCTLSILREDKIDSFVSGNKFRKLKYNVLEAKKGNYKTLLTFGGAFSNHIAATAKAGNSCGFKTIGIIRGEELAAKNHNPTLLYAKKQGMQLHFITREAYKKKDDSEFLKALKDEFGAYYLIPEGGTNALAVKGCEEILEYNGKNFDYICAAVGTGGTLAGLINESNVNQKVIGFSALKGDFQKTDVQKYTSNTTFEITDEYCYGGYAKINLELIQFINNFRLKTGIPLDPIYTGKMMFGILERVKNGCFNENSRILAVHTGGLQGIDGMNNYLKTKKLPLIDV